MSQGYKVGQTIEAIKDFKTNCNKKYQVFKGERLEILRVDSENDYCINKANGILWENNSWLLATTLNSTTQRIYSEDEDKITSTRKIQDQEFPIGSIVESAKTFEVANCGPTHVIKFGTKMKILYIDNNGDYLVHKLQSHRYESNFWIYRENVGNQIQMIDPKRGKQYDQHFPAGSIVEAIKNFDTDNVGSNHYIKKGDILKILKRDANGDYSINKFHFPWKKNSWIFHKDFESKVKLVKLKNKSRKKRRGEKYPEGTVFKSLYTFIDHKGTADISTVPIPKGTQLKVVNIDDDGHYWLQKINDNKFNWKIERKRILEKLQLISVVEDYEQLKKDIKESMNELKQEVVWCFKTPEKWKPKEIDLEEGSFVDAIANFQLNNQNTKYFALPGDRLKILRKDKMGDYLVNKISAKPWHHNSWISKKGIDSKIKLCNNCAKYHGLALFETTHHDFSCDECEIKFEKNTSMYGCRICNFDLCPSCYKNNGVIDANATNKFESFKTKIKINSSTSSQKSKSYHAGQIVTARKDFNTDSSLGSLEVRKNDKLQIIRIDAEGDLCVNLVNRRKWKKNSWILKNKCYRKIK